MNLNDSFIQNSLIYSNDEIKSNIFFFRLHNKSYKLSVLIADKNYLCV